jgi:RNA polymerase sigma factor (sigma-70 family)
MPANATPPDTTTNPPDTIRSSSIHWSALSRMSHHYPRCAQVVELRFFGDLELREIADMMELSLATVERDWRFARAWLRKSIQGGAHE